MLSAAVPPFHQRVVEVGTRARVVLGALADRFTDDGLTTDASLADVMAGRMTRLVAVDPDDVHFYERVADIAGLTAKGCKVLLDACAQIELDAPELEEVRELLSRLSYDCLVETQPVPPPPPFGSVHDEDTN